MVKAIQVENQIKLRIHPRVFAALGAGDELVREVTDLAKEGGTAEDALVRVQDFSAKLEIVRDALKTRFVYYSRLATVGTIAEMLVHEIRNRTTAIGRFLRSARKASWTTAEDKELRDQLALAENSVQSLERLADTFAPLASRGFRRGRRDSLLEESVARCLSMLGPDFAKEEVKIDSVSSSETSVAIDPGELDAIILNIFTNALYWLPKGNRKPKLAISTRRIQNGQRVRITISDSGPGVPEDDAEKIFLPEVTRKPGGIGMGLTVAAELVSDYGGRLSLEQPGDLGGATFAFDLPVKN